MPATSRRGRRSADHDDTGPVIRGVALHRFPEGGFNAARLRDIAADARVNIVLISYRFGSKLELWKAVTERLGADILARLASARVANEAVPPGKALVKEETFRAWLHASLIAPHIRHG